MWASVARGRPSPARTTGVRRSVRRKSPADGQGAVAFDRAVGQTSGEPGPRVLDGQRGSGGPTRARRWTGVVSSTSLGSHPVTNRRQNPRMSHGRGMTVEGPHLSASSAGRAAMTCRVSQSRTGSRPWSLSRRREHRTPSLCDSKVPGASSAARRCRRKNASRFLGPDRRSRKRSGA
jgi:hypothetical protein